MKKIKDILTKKELNKIERSEKKRFGATRKELEPFTLSLMIENYKPVVNDPTAKKPDAMLYGIPVYVSQNIQYVSSTTLLQLVEITLKRFPWLKLLDTCAYVISCGAISFIIVYVFFS